MSEQMVGNTELHRLRPIEPSLPGLTRQSILLKWRCFSKMDTRVKPAYDDSLIATAKVPKSGRSSRPRVRTRHAASGSRQRPHES
ncbi:MAG: hypothetical protein ACXW3X_03610, partial [Rhodoplanes sp.]